MQSTNPSGHRAYTKSFQEFLTEVDAVTMEKAVSSGWPIVCHVQDNLHDLPICQIRRAHDNRLAEDMVRVLSRVCAPANAASMRVARSRLVKAVFSAINLHSGVEGSK